MSVRRANAPAARQVVFDGRYVQDRYHGIGRYAFHLAQELADLLPAQHLDVLYDPSLPNSRFDWSALTARPNLDLVPVAAPPFALREQLVLPPLLAGRARSIYHTPYFALPWLLAPRTRALVTVHDCIFERDARYMPKRWARSYYKLLMTVSLARARAVFVPSKSTAADVRRFYRVPAPKMVVTPEAADPEFHPMAGEPVLDDVRAKYNLPREFVLAVGMRRPHKNFATLVRAVGQVEGATLLFAGEADERFPDDAAEAAGALGGRVRFLGKVPEDDLPALYNLATALACPSFVEGFGLPVLEAMACGTAVVCSDIPVFREVAEGAALLVDPASVAAWTSALARILGDRALREQLVAAGLERAAQFSWARAARAALPVYRSLGAAPRP